MPVERTSERGWSLVVAVTDIPQSGRRFELRADERTRAAVASLTGLRTVARLEAQFEVRRHGADGLHVTGTVSATVGQFCVVSLEPIESEIEEGIDLVFVPGAESGHAAGVAGAEEGPEPLVDGRIDLGAIATEFLVLGIDPHPREPGVVFEPPAIEDDPAAHPFAALAALKKGDGGTEC
jgi:uncharacterized metal-binding protein YceD (DUF177 family)